MNKPDVRIFQTLEELSREAATRFEQLAAERAAGDRIFTAALSGGSTPRRLYELLAGAEFSSRIPWKSVHLFEVDERCVAPSHPQSNYRMIQEALLSHVSIPRENFHRMEAEREDPNEAAWEYAAEVAQVLEPPPGEWPQFDLVLLGMGPDGHTASLFPGTAALREQSRWVSANYVEKLRAHRISLTFPVINSAAEIIFLVAGDDKAAVLGEVLAATTNGAGAAAGAAVKSAVPEKFPAQKIRPKMGRLSWYIDQAAASLLPRATPA